MAKDEELMSQIANKDQAALDNICGRYRSRLFRAALRITGDAGIAEEVLQDSFFQLWLKASQFDGARGSLIGWLLAIVRYRAISCLRGKNDRLRHNAVSCDDTFLRSGAGPTPLEQQIARELASVALASLSTVQRDAINLAYSDGLTCEEISLRTDAPLGTVKGRLRSAHQEMKKALSNPGLAASAKRHHQFCTLEDILITDQLLSRPHRQRFAQTETESLRVLSQVATNSPELLIDAFLQMAIDLCGAGTAGLSFLEHTAKGKQIFRWTNLVGQLKENVGGTTPRNFSPCGVTLDRDSPQLFAYPGRYFHYFNDVSLPIVEGLVIPFRIGKDTEGTVWIVAHKEGVEFDSEDARIMTSLTEFAACALHATRSLTSAGPLRSVMVPTQRVGRTLSLD